MRLTKKQRDDLRLKFGGKCAYCGCDLPVKGWHADHVEPVMRLSETIRDYSNSGYTHKTRHTGEYDYPERNRIDNFYPSCAPCNLFKSTFSIEGFRREISEQVDRARRSSVNFRTAERFGQIIINKSPIKFWYEIYEN